MFDQPPPPPPSSRSLRMAEIRQTVERLAPSIDQTKILTDEELHALQRARETRAADEACAAREGRKKLREKLHQSVERLTGSTPVGGTPLSA